MAKKNIEEKKDFPICPPLSWLEYRPDFMCNARDGEALYIVPQVKEVLAPSRFAARRGETVLVSNSGVPCGYVTASPGFVVFGSMLARRSDDPDEEKTNRAEAAEAIKRHLAEKALIPIGTIEAWGDGAHWAARLSPEGKRIILDSEAFIANLVNYPETTRRGEEIDAKGEDLFLVTEGKTLPLYGMREPLRYPQLVTAASFDEGYRADPDGQRAEAIKRRLSDGSIVAAGRIYPTTEESPNVLSGKHTRFRLELEKTVRQILEPMAEEDFYARRAAWAERGRPGYEPTRY